MPSLENTLMPLSSAGLCDAEMTTPASARMLCVMNAMPGVGSTPVRQATPPIDVTPASKALSSM